jgi:hypothetical protein
MAKIRRGSPAPGQPGGPTPSINQNDLGNRNIQTYIKAQIYMKGYTQGVNAGNNANLANITSLGGSARKLFGIAIWVSQANVADDDTFSLKINNETIIDSVYWRTFNPQFNLKLDQFFPLPRPLSGSDTLVMSWTAINAKTIYPIFYLSDYNE